MLKNTAANEVGEGKQMARESNLSQGIPQRSKTNGKAYFSYSQTQVKYWNITLLTQ